MAPERPSEAILNDFDAAARGEADIDIREVLNEIIGDIRGRYSLVMHQVGIAASTVQEVEQSVAEYVANNYEAA